MKAQAEISLYPLRQSDLTEPIHRFCQLLAKHKLKVKTGAMSSLVTGDSEIIFRALSEAYVQMSQEYDLVLTAKISNACPGTEENQTNL